ncbi:hypothetical protein ABVT39_010962 [Epinephelus coioides]
MSVQCKHMQTQTSPVNSSCTCMDKQLYSTLLQTPSSTHLNKVSFCFYLWDLTTSSSDGPPPLASPTHGVLRLPVQPSPQPTAHSPPRPRECLSTYLPHVLTSLSLSRPHRGTKHTPTLLPHVLKCISTFIGSLLRKSCSLQSLVLGEVTVGTLCMKLLPTMSHLHKTPA